MLVGPTAPRLLSSWCWRERQVPAFSAVLAPGMAPGKAPQLHQELLLGFDVSEGFHSSLLKLTVKQTQKGPRCLDTKLLDWDVYFQVTVLSLYNDCIG